jgi:hypothetical protein
MEEGSLPRDLYCVTLRKPLAMNQGETTEFINPFESSQEDSDAEKDCKPEPDPGRT